MDIVSLHERALDETAQLVDGVRPDQLGLPTPCASWDVRALLTHLVGGNMRYAAVASGTPWEQASVAADPLGDDPAGAYRRSVRAAKAAWRDPALLDHPFTLPFGVWPGRVAVGMRLIETVAHGWDLARATGQRPAFAPDIVEAATQCARSSLAEERPPGTPYAAPVPVADDLPAIDRLAAFLGRTP